MKNYIQLGNNLDVTATEDLSDGDLITVKQIAGVVVADTAVGELGAISTEGVFALAKGNEPFTMGDPVMVASTADYTRNLPVTADDGSGTSIGVVTQAAAAGAATVRVKLKQ